MLMTGFKIKNLLHGEEGNLGLSRKLRGIFGQKGKKRELWTKKLIPFKNRFPPLKKGGASFPEIRGGRGFAHEFKFQF